MNNKQITQMSTTELITKSKREDKLWPKLQKLFWFVCLGGLLISVALVVIADLNKLPVIISDAFIDIFMVLWFVATLVTLFILTFYQRLSNLHHNELAKRK